MKLLCIVGQAGAGKTKSAQIMQGYGFISLEAGDIIRDRFSHEALLNETILSFVERLFESEGYDLHANQIAHTLYNKAQGYTNLSGAVVSGLRTPQQITKLSYFFSHSFTVAIYASPAIRFARIGDRKRNDDPCTFIDFIREDFRELAWGLDRVLYEAPYYIFNEGTIEELEKQLRSLPFLSL